MPDFPSRQKRLEYYKATYAACMFRPGTSEEAGKIVLKINEGKAIYSQIADAMGITLWQVIGILHSMECSFDFGRHLANGDLLSQDTIRVPRNLMAPKLPPFDFVTAGIAALRHYASPSGWGSLSITDIPSALLFFDQWNGLGEWYHTETPGLPYLFAGTSAYKSGKFESDGKWNPDLISQQIGAGAILKAIDFS